MTENHQTALVLLDRALADALRSERRSEDSYVEPLYFTTLRWDLVREARKLLDE